MPPLRMATHIVRFDDFEVDTVGREIRKRGVKRKLAGQPFEILRTLLRRHHRVVTRDELKAQLWPKPTFGDLDRRLNASINKLRVVLGDSAEQPRYIQTVSRFGYRFIAPVADNKQGRARRDIRSLVVLPLENLFEGPDQEYFADGMTEALINDLAKIRALRVICRNSALFYKGVRKPLAEIAQELDVDAIVTGTVRRSTGRLRISVELVDPCTGTTIWSQSYDENLRDVFNLQSKVASEIASEIRIKVTAEEKARLNQGGRLDPKAHEAYFRGRGYWNLRTPDSLRRSVEHFRQALEIDPDYARAYAGIASTYVVLGSVPYEVIPSKIAMPMARHAAEQALKIDKNLAEAHAALAYINWMFDFHWEGAERGFRHALELNPGYATARQWYGVYLSQLGRNDEAKREILRAREQDPHSLQVNTAVAEVCYFVRDYDEAIKQAQKTIAMEDTFPRGHFILALAYLQSGKPTQGLIEGQKAADLSGNSSSALACIAACHAALGRTEEAMKMIADLGNRTEYVPSYAIAWIFAALRDKEAALKHLEQAMEGRSSFLSLIGADPALDFLRLEPRFKELQSQVGLSTSILH